MPHPPALATISGPVCSPNCFSRIVPSSFRSKSRRHDCIGHSEFHHRHRRLRSFRRASAQRTRVFSLLFGTGRWANATWLCAWRKCFFIALPKGTDNNSKRGGGDPAHIPASFYRARIEITWPEWSGFLRCCHGGQCGTRLNGEG